MKVNKYLVLHSGDRILMQKNLDVFNIQIHTQRFNDNLLNEIQIYERDVRDTASHIELVLAHKDK